MVIDVENASHVNPLWILPRKLNKVNIYHWEAIPKNIFPWNYATGEIMIVLKGMCKII